MKQIEVLKKILEENKNTEFGVLHNFSRIESVEHYQNSVQINTYESLKPFIDRQINEFKNQLSSEPPILYLKTSGTTGFPKFIPLTKKTIDVYRLVQANNIEVQEALVPNIFAGKILDIVSPMVETIDKNGLKFGSMSGVVSECLPDEIKLKYLLPRNILKIKNFQDRYQAITEKVLSEKNITCIASANPTSIIKLLEFIDKFSPTSNSEKYSDVFPNLKAIVCWTNGNCSIVLPKLRSLLGDPIIFIEMGYIASEFWGSMLAKSNYESTILTSEYNYFEFIPVENWEDGEKKTISFDELENGRYYYVIVTTLDGLYRYFINDIIKIVGYDDDKRPKVVFWQKGSGITNLTGEKLTENQIIEAINFSSQSLCIQSEKFIFIADKNTFSYHLYIETDDTFDEKAFSKMIDSKLKELNMEYQSKRESERLGALTIFRLNSGTFDRYREHLVKLGQRETQLKISPLKYSDQLTFNFSDFTCR